LKKKHRHNPYDACSGDIQSAAYQGRRANDSQAAATTTTEKSLAQWRQYGVAIALDRQPAL
jgi:hypothetical protein